MGKHLKKSCLIVPSSFLCVFFFALFPIALCSWSLFTLSDNQSRLFPHRMGFFSSSIYTYFHSIFFCYFFCSHSRIVCNSHLRCTKLTFSHAGLLIVPSEKKKREAWEKKPTDHIICTLNGLELLSCDISMMWLHLNVSCFVCLYVNGKIKGKLHYRHNTNLYSIQPGVYIFSMCTRKEIERNPSHPTANVKTLLQQKLFIHRVANGRRFQIYSLTDKYQYILINLWPVTHAKENF